MSHRTTAPYACLSLEELEGRRLLSGSPFGTSLLPSVGESQSSDPGVIQSANNPGPSGTGLEIHGHNADWLADQAKAKEWQARLDHLHQDMRMDAQLANAWQA